MPRLGAGARLESGFHGLALDRRTPPPSGISGTRNRLLVNAGRPLSRRRTVLAVAANNRTTN